MAESMMIQLIQRYDIGPNRARHNVNSQLQRFSIDDVRRILESLQPLERIYGSNEPCGPLFNRHVRLPLWMRGTLFAMVSIGTALLVPFQAGASVVLFFRGQFSAIWKELPRPTFDLIAWARDMVSFVKAPLYLVRKSIEQGAALCINRQGRFSIRDKGYAAMSHVWGETMGWQSKDSWGAVELSLRKMGLARQHFLRFFDLCEAEWLWVDVIAMPEVLEDMEDAQKEDTEKLRVGVINCLKKIYSNADKVVVIDTLLLRLSTRSPLDVAAILCLSFWVTRLWTFTETRLAKKIILKTRDYSFDLDEILELLAKTIINDEHRYYNIFLRLVHLREESVHGFPACSLLESAFWACENRYTNVDVDQCRILFPLLDLKWEYGWTLNQGLSRILEVFPGDAASISQWCTYRSIEFDVASVPSGVLIDI